MHAEDGLLIVDKPEGPTSHDIVQAVRRCFGTPRVGHTGTLDPFASGVLVVCVGKATRLSRFLQSETKRYRGTIRFGFATDTHDRTGKPISECREPALDETEIEAIMKGLTGEFEQVPPMFSAKKVDGVRLYAAARKGRDIPRESRTVTIYAMGLLAAGGDTADFEVTCSAGTYIRTLAHEIGKRAGCGAHLAALRRLAVGPFIEEQAFTLDAIRGWDRPAGHLIPLEEIPLGFPTVHLTGPEGARVRHGMRITVASDRLAAGAVPRASLLSDGLLLAVAEVELDGALARLKPDIVFP
jgi:tRNA pseudouridine55 synthase